MNTKPVAAVYDRRTTMACLPVAAVYDRRMENEPALIERRYRAVYDRRRRSCLAGIAFLFLFFSPLLLAAPQKQTALPVQPTVVYDTTVKVLRGGTCEVPLRAISPQGYDVEFKTISESGPRAGSLSGPQRNSKSSVSYFYTHNGKKGAAQDSFRIKAQSGPQKAWGYAKVTILVEEPPARFAADVSSLDFGSVFLGESRTLPVRIKNAGGGQLKGPLKASASWKLGAAGELTLAEGQSQEILITFEPLSTDTQRGSLVFESGTKPFPEIILEGVGESRFEAPESAAFEQRVGANELRIPIKNLTAAPLPISVQFPQPLEAPDSIQLPPNSSVELVLILPPRPFAEKSVLVTLGDGASLRDIRIQLPPPPSRLEWEVDGKKQLGVVTPGRTVWLDAKLHNTGSSQTRALIRTTGDGFALALGQQDAFDIAPSGYVILRAEWKFSEKLGASCATLVAETEGLSPVKTSWEADVQLPSAVPRSSPTLGALPTPTPTPPGIISEEALRKRMPRDFSYRLEPDLHWTAFFPTRRTATAILSWSYEGLEPVEFIIQREVQQRKGFFDKNPFERTLPTPEDLPPQSLDPVWIPLEPSIAQIQKLPDGRRQAHIPALSSGYHKIRVIAKTPNTTCMDGSEFNILVGDIPLPQPLPWTLPALLALCAIYLLRKKFAPSSANIIRLAVVAAVYDCRAL